jgi:hypothetical protein
MTTHVPAHAARSFAGPLHLCPSDWLQLALALCCAFTGTAGGLTMAAVVRGLLAARRSARRALDRSVAVRRGVLAPPPRTGALRAAGHPRQHAARP